MVFYRVTKNIYTPGEKIWETGENNGFVNNRANLTALLPMVAFGLEDDIQNILSSFAGTDRDGVQSSYTEAILEHVRTQEFPSLPARFKNMHVFRDLKSAQEFRAIYRASSKPSIYEIYIPENTQYFSGDMNIYTYAPSSKLKDLTEVARKYWRGESGEVPFEEIMLYPHTEAIVKRKI